MQLQFCKPTCKKKVWNKYGMAVEEAASSVKTALFEVTERGCLKV